MEHLQRPGRLETAQRAVDGCDLHHGLAAADGPFVVLAQAPPAAHAAERLLHDPAYLQRSEALLPGRLAADLQTQAAPAGQVGLLN